MVPVHRAFPASEHAIRCAGIHQAPNNGALGVPRTDLSPDGDRASGYLAMACPFDEAGYMAC